MERGIVLAALIALGTGVGIGLQGPMNSQLAKTIGLLESTFIVLLSGAAAVGVALLLGMGDGSFRTLGRAPLPSLLGGIVGIFIVIGVVLTIGRLGVVAGIAVILIAQLGVGSAVDHFGLFGLERNPITPRTFAGIALLVVGAVIIRR